jgi:hypothetical protein
MTLAFPGSWDDARKRAPPATIALISRRRSFSCQGLTGCETNSCARLAESIFVWARTEAKMPSHLPL